MSDVNDATEAKSTAPPDKSPGQLLAEARDRAGLAQQQVAAQLNIQLSKIQALEEDGYNKLFSPVFVRGYLRSCAKLYGIDGEQLVALYDAHYDSREPTSIVADSLQVEITGSASPWPKRILLIGVLLALLGLVYWYAAAQKTNAPAPTAMATMKKPLMSVPESTAVQSVAPGADAPVESEPELNAEPREFTDEPLTADEILTAADTDSVADTVVGAESPADTGLDVLVLHFAEECWLEVQDANGDALAADVKSSGSQVTLQGIAPFSVKLGNYGQGVKAEVNGVVVAIPARGRSSVVTYQMDDTSGVN